MPNHVRCCYERPGNPDKDHVVTMIMPGHPLAGETAILGCYKQPELKELNVGDIIIAKDNFRLSKNNVDYLGDAVAPFLQPTSKSYVELQQELKTSEVTVLPASRELSDDPGLTREYTIEISNLEHKKFFEKYAAECKRGNLEAGRKLIGFAIDQLSAAKQFDLPEGF